VTGRFTEFDIGQSAIMKPLLDWAFFSPSKGEGWGCMSVWKITGNGKCDAGKLFGDLVYGINADRGICGEGSYGYDRGLAVRCLLGCG